MGTTYFHVAAPTPKHVQNSRRGVRKAHRRGCGGIEFDILITLDNAIVATHWGRPMRMDGFRDPLHRIDPEKRVRDLTLAKVTRLRAGRFPVIYHISRIETLLAYAARYGLKVRLDVKDDRRFEQDWPWAHLAAVVDDIGVHVIVRSLANQPVPDAGRRRMAAARRHGFDASVF